MDMLVGKKALVAGIANKKSIAWSIAEAFHKEGAEIAIFCLESNKRRVEKLAKEIDAKIVIPCDVKSDESILEAFTTLGEIYDNELDILVHSIAFANIEDLGSEFINIRRSGWNLALEISAFSLVALAKNARKMMKNSKGGSILTLTFGGGEDVVPGYNIMGIAKAALNMSVKYLAYDLGPDNIRINAISSGPIRTFSSMMIQDFEKSLKIMEKYSPLLRNITLEDLNGTAIYLASEQSSGVTGMVIDVDSGMHILRPPADKHRKCKN